MPIPLSALGLSKRSEKLVGLEAGAGVQVNVNQQTSLIQNGQRSFEEVLNLVKLLTPRFEQAFQEWRGVAAPIPRPTIFQKCQHISRDDAPLPRSKTGRLAHNNAQLR